MLLTDNKPEVLLLIAFNSNCIIADKLSAITANPDGFGITPVTFHLSNLRFVYKAFLTVRIGVHSVNSPFMVPAFGTFVFLVINHLFTFHHLFKKFTTTSMSRHVQMTQVPPIVNKRTKCILSGIFIQFFSFIPNSYNTFKLLGKPGALRLEDEINK